MMFETIKDYYKKGLFTEADLGRFVLVGWLTAAQRNEIGEGV